MDPSFFSCIFEAAPPRLPLPRSGTQQREDCGVLDGIAGPRFPCCYSTGSQAAFSRDCPTLARYEYAGLCSRLRVASGGLEPECRVVLVVRLVAGHCRWASGRPIESPEIVEPFAHTDE